MATPDLLAHNLHRQPEHRHHHVQDRNWLHDHLGRPGLVSLKDAYLGLALILDLLQHLSVDRLAALELGDQEVGRNEGVADGDV